VAKATRTFPVRRSFWLPARTTSASTT